MLQFVLIAQGLAEFSMFLPLVTVGVLFYFMMLRPEKQRRIETDQMQQALKKNDRIITFSGIYGTVVNAQQGSRDVTIKVDESSNTKLRVLRSSIQQVLDKDKSDEVDA